MLLHGIEEETNDFSFTGVCLNFDYSFKFLLILPDSHYFKMQLLCLPIARSLYLTFSLLNLSFCFIDLKSSLQNSYTCV